MGLCTGIKTGGTVLIDCPTYSIKKQNKPMIDALRKCAVCFLVGFTTTSAAQAQTTATEPESLPGKLSSEKIVTEVAPIKAIDFKAITTTETETASNAQFGETIVKTALQYLGASYRMGSTGPTVFDCSGFTSFVYRKADVAITRTSRSQFTEGTPIARIADLKKGDLVFFGSRGNARSVGHVGIVTEVDPSGKNFSFVHASIRGVKVSNSSEKYYNRRYLGARRIVTN